VAIQHFCWFPITFLAVLHAQLGSFVSSSLTIRYQKGRITCARTERISGGESYNEKNLFYEDWRLLASVGNGERRSEYAGIRRISVNGSSTINTSTKQFRNH
jgi:hypothetical protein